MSALAVQAMIAAAPLAAAPAAAATPAPEAGFAALLGQFAEPPKDAQARKDDATTPDAPDAPALNLMQSLEAALAGMAAYPASPIPKTAAPVAAAALPQTTADKAASALSAAAGALGANAFDASGRTPLKSLLAADPTLGLGDFQIKTFLAATGAAPAKTGGTTLGADSAWSPFEAAKIASALGAAADDAKRAASTPSADGAKLATSAPSEAAVATAPLPEAAPVASASAAVAAVAPAVSPPLPAALAPVVAPAPAAAASLPAAPTAAAKETAPTPAPPQPIAGGAAAPAAARTTHGVATSRPAGPAPRSSESAPVAPANAADANARRNDGEAAASTAAPVAATAATPDSPAAPTLTVPFAQLSAFIATQAETLAAGGPEAAQSAGAATTETTPKAAQAVKELQIQLDPGDLGEMTLKLRLAGGKLSVTIAVANPQTLGAIEGDRALIAARLGAGDSALEDLVIQRQTLIPSTQETGSTHAPANDTRDDDAQRESPPPRDGRPGGSRRGAGDGGAFRDFLV